MLELSWSGIHTWLTLRATCCMRSVNMATAPQFLQQETRYILKKAHLSPVDLRCEPAAVGGCTSQWLPWCFVKISSPT